ncbi:hypothetical protein ACWDSJ_28245 [Nocardia sp. NPDC003482]
MSLLTAMNIWPLVCLLLAVVTVTVIALMRADRKDIPEVFAAFAQAFGIHRTAARPKDSEETGMLRPADTEKPGEEEA